MQMSNGRLNRVKQALSCVPGTLSCCRVIWDEHRHACSSRLSDKRGGICGMRSAVTAVQGPACSLHRGDSGGSTSIRIVPLCCVKA